MGLNKVAFGILCVAGDVFGMTLFCSLLYLWNKFHKNDDHKVPKREKKVTNRSENIALTIPETDDEDAGGIMFKLTFKTKGDGVEDLVHGVIDSLLGIEKFARMINKDEIICDIINERKAKTEMIIHFDGDTQDLKMNKGYRKAKEVLNSIECVKGIKLFDMNGNKIDDRESEVDDQFVPKIKEQTKANLLIFEVVGQNAKDYGYQLIDELMANKEFLSNVYEKNLLMITKKSNKPRAKINIVLMHDENVEGLEMKHIKKAYDKLTADESVRKVRVNKIPWFL